LLPKRAFFLKIYICIAPSEVAATKERTRQRKRQKKQEKTRERNDKSSSNNDLKRVLQKRTRTPKGLIEIIGGKFNPGMVFPDLEERSYELECQYCGWYGSESCNL